MSGTMGLTTTYLVSTDKGKYDYNTAVGSGTEFREIIR